jgi:hypothetical protein
MPQLEAAVLIDRPINEGLTGELDTLTYHASMPAAQGAVFEVGWRSTPQTYETLV